jgi:hypothetical protein
MKIWLIHELYQSYKKPEVVSRLQLKELGGWSSCLEKRNAALAEN